MALAIMTTAAAAVSVAGQCPYTSDGPCTPVSREQTGLQADVQGGTVKLDVKVTIPHESTAFQPPYPLVFFFNGFQARLWPRILSHHQTSGTLRRD